MIQPAGRAIFLVGFMGCGKSTVGRVLATRLGWDFVDTDERIESREGRSIPEIFQAAGEPYFRELERALLAERTRPRTVIAAGGGAFLSSHTRRMLVASGLTVWLDAPLELLRTRIGTGHDRPLWNPSDPLAQRVLYERRRAVYALAALRIRVDGGASEAVAEVIDGKIR